MVALQFPICMVFFSGSDPSRHGERIQGKEGTLAFPLNRPLFLSLSLLCLYLCPTIPARRSIPRPVLAPILFFLSRLLGPSFESEKMMMKKKGRVFKEPSASTSYLPAGDEARARFRHHSLLQDYQELLWETEEKRERLQKAMQKKLQLLAEVKFLRMKCREFSAAPKTIHPKLEKQSLPQHPVFLKELSSKGSRIQKGKHIPSQTSAALFDLNQVSAPTGEEMEWLDQNAGMLKRFSMEGGDALASDAMQSICRDSGIGSSRSTKRKVSWHDPLALRV